VNAETKIAAILFDYGVVLSGPPEPAAWARMQQIAGLDTETFARAYWAPRHDYDRGHHTGREYWLAAGRTAGIELTVEAIESLIAADTDLWTQVNEPMVAWAARLQAAGTPTGILSNLGDEMTEGVLSRQPWIAAFDYALWSHAVRMAKPEAAIYRLAADGLRMPPQAILFIDDRSDNIAGALAAGMQTVLYVDQASFEQELEHRGLRDLWRSGRLS
jgi:putative hydrolase of the HAD superfamily